MMTSSTTNKYAGLPDIDLDQQDIYETPDILDDVSTVPTSLSADEDEDIQRQDFSIEAARQRFADERVDAEYADFSDTLIARQKQQSYRTSKQEVSTKTETLEEKIGRVRREMEEIRMEMLQENKPDTEIQEWEGIIHSQMDDHIATKVLTTRIQKLVSTIPTTSNSTSYTLSYSPSEAIQLSTISSRLTSLESLLGLPLTNQSTFPILPTLSHLSSKLNLVSSQSQIDVLSTRIKSLLTDLSLLEEKRDQARQRALLEDSPPPTTDTENSDEKVNALYAALGNIDRIAPIIPGVVERLRGMRIVHADAAAVTSGIKDVGERMGRMEIEVKEWEEVLGQVEAGLKEVARRVAGVMERIEGVITGLEGRVKKLEV